MVILSSIIKLIIEFSQVLHKFYGYGNLAVLDDVLHIMKVNVEDLVQTSLPHVVIFLVVTNVT